MGVASLHALREQIRALEGAPVAAPRRPLGVAALDELLGGVPVPGVLEVYGPSGSGRTRLALGLVAAAQARHERVAWVDCTRTLYPPAAAAMGVDLGSLLVVHPPADRAAWATEQLLRSGGFPLVVASDPGELGPAGLRWARAAEAGRGLAVVLGERASRSLGAGVRLATHQGEVLVARNRGGRVGGRAELGAHPVWLAA